MKRVYAVIAMGAVAFALALTANLAQAGVGNAGNPGILPPGSSPYGSTYAEWSVKWWQWVMSQPTTNSAILGTGGCSAGQSGPVWFLVGAFAPTTETRQCTIPPGTALFFPIYNGWADNTACPEWTTYPVEELVSWVSGWVDAMTGLTCTIDEKSVKGLDPAITSPYRVGPQVFTYTLAEQDNILAGYFGMTCIADGTTVYPAAGDGVYLMVAPLSAGQHTIHFTVPGFLDITYELTVEK
jgi:hypothetical protein